MVWDRVRWRQKVLLFAAYKVPLPGNFDCSNHILIVSLDRRKLWDYIRMKVKLT